ncbi:cytochrome P450 family protein [Actinomycetospora straminea]|uniref:Cytochrome P450 n=1 Tax=Actinomycetospora straminea TaxID=663607 RepID=A0ABP9F8Z2_9PSEU|nr:cytochrome P450 [Actinomycetospora straminea]MDD7934754.1 cytochrome P450 [Actinomycetospora straminea]
MTTSRAQEPAWSDVPGAELGAVDITSKEFTADPFGFWARLRSDAPVQSVRWTRGSTAWVVTRYPDVEAVLRDPRLRKDPRNALTPRQLATGLRFPRVLAPLERGLLSLDAPDHDRLRRLVSQAFTPRRIEQMREQAEQITDSLLDTATRRGSMDLIEDFAVPLPLIVIARIIGVPEKDVSRFRRWTQALFGLADRPARNIPSVQLFLRYLRRLIAARSRDARDDLTSAMVAARDSGDRLTDDEILSMLVLLLTAGHETTVNLIGVGTLALLEHPAQADLLRSGHDDPGLVKTAVEELLRFTSPAETATERWPDRDLEIAGTTVPQGARVLAVLASANHDPAVFADPDRLDLTRTPNPHLAFGKGAHYCLGAPLARLEAQVAIPALLRRAPQLRRLDPTAPVAWRGTAIVRGLETLPVLL